LRALPRLPSQLRIPFCTRNARSSLIITTQAVGEKSPSRFQWALPTLLSRCVEYRVFSSFMLPEVSDCTFQGIENFFDMNFLRKELFDPHEARQKGWMLCLNPSMN
jgi:hypothetical protein